MLSEVSFQKEENSPWGFRLTGGPQFGMPLTVFEVEEGGRAYKAGIRLGDVLDRINGMAADKLSLDDAHNIIGEAGNNITLSISNLEDQELRENELIAKENALETEDTDTEISQSQEITKSDYSVDELSDKHKSEVSEASSEVQIIESGIDEISETAKSVEEILDDSNMPKATIKTVPAVTSKVDAAENLLNNDLTVMEEEEQYVDVNSLPLLPPRPAPEPERAQRRCWHPVMLDTNPPPIIEETTGDEEYPHKKTLRNIRKAIQDKKHHSRRKGSKEGNSDANIIEDDAVAVQLRTVQQQLTRLAQLPATIQATLHAVSASIQHLLAEPEDETFTDSETCSQSETSGEILEEDLTESIEVITEEDSSDMEAFQQPASQSPSPAPPTPAPSPTPSAIFDEMEKLAKQQKMDTLNKSWPWADNARPIYKIADHYEPMYARCINNKVKWLEEKISEEHILARRLKGI